MGIRTKTILAAALCGLAWGQTGLTTIQDTLIRADGARFTGSLTIHWVTFDSSNNGTVVQQSTSVSVVNGNLLVQLVPNAAAPPPANVYTVTYQSDGREQFTETWSVPTSSTPLKVATVRTGNVIVTTGSNQGTAGNQTPITESTVIGLVADLAQRPIKGVGFGTSRVAMVNDAGQIETVVGDIGDCVFVDGTTGPCGQATYSDAETPTGTVDGTNNTLVLASAPLGSSLMLFRNGLYLTPGFDYMLNGSTVQFVTGATPQTGDRLTASYRVDTSQAGNIGGISDGPPLRTAATQVLCSSAGTSTSLTVLTTLGTCDIPAAGLRPGDRIEVRFTFAHTGTTSGMNVQLAWGGTMVLSRNASAQDSAVTGHADAGITANGSQVSIESWGAVLPLLPGIVNVPASTSGITVRLKAAMAQPSLDSVALTNYSVLRYPAN
jgi:hypothetical protein